MSAQTRGHHNPSTRLGGSAFNHQQSAGSEEEYDRLRNLARQEHSRMADCFDKAHAAHSAGNGSEAHSLSEAGKRHQAAAQSYNAQASSFIFRENNSTSRVASDTIDLHGQFVEEAEDILEARIKQARAENQTHLHVIVGKGNHSPGHVQKIKPRVEQVCRELGLRYRTEENEGRIFVDLTGGEVDYDIPPTGQAPGKYQGGYQGQQGGYQQGGGYGGQQGTYANAAGGGTLGAFPGGHETQDFAHQGYPGQQHAQGHQRPPQVFPFEQEEVQKKEELSLNCLKGCCIVM